MGRLDTTKSISGVVLRFHWHKDDCAPLETLRFTRVVFGLAPSPYLLQGVIESHLDVWSEQYPKEVEHLGRSMYMDDLLSRGLTVKQAEARKDVAQDVMQDATFELHKWSSNVRDGRYQLFHSIRYLLDI